MSSSYQTAKSLLCIKLVTITIQPMEYLHRNKEGEWDRYHTQTLTCRLRGGEKQKNWKILSFIFTVAPSNENNNLLQYKCFSITPTTCCWPAVLMYVTLTYKYWQIPLDDYYTVAQSQRTGYKSSDTVVILLAIVSAPTIQHQIKWNDNTTVSRQIFSKLILCS